MNISFLLLTLCVAALIGFLLLRRKTANNLPPGPSFLSSNFLVLTSSLSDLEHILKNLKSKYGPLITLFIGSRPSIFVADHSLAHQVLIQAAVAFVRLTSRCRPSRRKSALSPEIRRRRDRRRRRDKKKEADAATGDKKKKRSKKKKR